MWAAGGRTYGRRTWLLVAWTSQTICRKPPVAEQGRMGPGALGPWTPGRGAFTLEVAVLPRPAALRPTGIGSSDSPGTDSRGAAGRALAVSTSLTSVGDPHTPQMARQCRIQQPYCARRSTPRNHHDPHGAAAPSTVGQGEGARGALDRSAKPPGSPGLGRTAFIPTSPSRSSGAPCQRSSPHRHTIEHSSIVAHSHRTLPAAAPAPARNSHQSLASLVLSSSPLSRRPLNGGNSRSLNFKQQPAKTTTLNIAPLCPPLHPSLPPQHHDANTQAHDCTPPGSPSPGSSLAQPQPQPQALPATRLKVPPPPPALTAAPACPPPTAPGRCAPRPPAPPWPAPPCPPSRTRTRRTCLRAACTACGRAVAVVRRALRGCLPDGLCVWVHADS